MKIDWVSPTTYARGDGDGASVLSVCWLRTMSVKYGFRYGATMCKGGEFIARFRTEPTTESDFQEVGGLPNEEAAKAVIIANLMIGR